MKFCIVITLRIAALLDLAHALPSSSIHFTTPHSANPQPLSVSHLVHPSNNDPSYEWMELNFNVAKWNDRGRIATGPATSRTAAGGAVLW